MKHRPELDGIRGLAIALVVAAHAGVPVARWGGQVGVTLFFVLSGYLITGLLAAELRTTGRVDLRAFYARRARRLLPALAVVLAVALALGWVGVSQAGAIALYVGNWWRVTGDGLGHLGHTWSLSIEEQFYIVWPVVLLAGLRSPRVLVGLAVGSMALRVIAADGFEQFSTLTRADGLLVGSALALWGRPLPGGALAVGGLVVLSAVPFERGVFLDWGLAATVFVAAVAVGGAGPGALGMRPLRWLGEISYALYLWHIPLMAVLPIPIAIPASVVIAWASTRFLERRFRRRRSAGGGDRQSSQYGLTNPD